jgi:hypothetical protein
MKITIDIERQTIYVIEEIEVVLLIKYLQDIFPNGDWQEYTIKPHIDTDKTYTPYSIDVKHFGEENTTTT